MEPKRGKTAGGRGRGTNTAGRCVVWPALKLILPPHSAFPLLSIWTKEPAPDSREERCLDSGEKNGKLERKRGAFGRTCQVRPGRMGGGWGDEREEERVGKFGVVGRIQWTQGNGMKHRFEQSSDTLAGFAALRGCSEKTRWIKKHRTMNVGNAKGSVEEAIQWLKAATEVNVKNVKSIVCTVSRQVRSAAEWQGISKSHTKRKKYRQ